jgi:hypothetical protein
VGSSGSGSYLLREDRAISAKADARSLPSAIGIEGEKAPLKLVAGVKRGGYTH